MSKCYICGETATHEYKPNDLIERPLVVDPHFYLCSRCFEVARNKKSKPPAIDRTYWITQLRRSSKNKVFHCAITGIPLQTNNDSKPDYLSFDHLIPHSSHSRSFKKGDKIYTVVQGQPVAQLINDMKSDLSNQTFLELTQAILDSAKGDQKASEKLHSIITNSDFNFNRGNFKNTRFCKQCDLRFPAKTICPNCGK